MYTYINENFLHAPSTDLNHDTVKTLITVMLAQAQEVFFDKQVADGKKTNIIAKLAGQLAVFHNQAVEGVQENVNKGVFEKVWLQLTQFKAAHYNAVAQYYQALTDDETNAHGSAIARLQVAERHAKEASKLVYSFPSSPSGTSHIPSDAGQVLTDMAKKISANITAKLVELNKDNDFIYHDIIPNEASLKDVPKMAAAKAIPINDIYQGQDVQRVIGPDIFARIVPMSVTESASLYDEEKAKMLRAENERAEQANSEMAASLDYLKLPGSLNVLKGGMETDLVVDEEFRQWCQDLAGYPPFGQDFEQLGSRRTVMLGALDKSSTQLDMEESVCEKMRSRYGSEWIQQPSSRLNATLRSDIRSYRKALNEASTSDAQLQSTLQEHETDFEEMRSAGHADEADVLYQRALLKAGAAKGQGNGVRSPMSYEGDLLGDDFDGGEGGMSVVDQIAHVEDLVKRLNLIKRERAQVLKDLKEKVGSHPSPLEGKSYLTHQQVHTDDISHILIHAKKATGNQENQLFKVELEKFRPFQVRLLQANHKQSAIFKELTRVYSELLQDKRVRAEQNKYEILARQRGSVLNRYRKAHQAFIDLRTGLERAQKFYADMKTTIESQSLNVESFLGNRKSEGGDLLQQIERKKTSNGNGQANADAERMQSLMGRMNIGSPAPSQPISRPDTGHRPTPGAPQPGYPGAANALMPGQSVSYPMQAPPYGGGPPSRQQPPVTSPIYQSPSAPRPNSQTAYNPGNYGPMSPPVYPGAGYMSPQVQQHPHNPYTSQGGYASPPPLHGATRPQTYPVPPSGQYGVPPTLPHSQQSQQNTQAQQADPWAGLGGWK